MLERPLLPIPARGRADDVHDWHVLRVGPGNAVGRAELADAEGGQHSADSVDPGVPVGRVGRVELVTVADPGDVAREHVVEEGEVIVPRNAEEVAHAHLSQPFKQVIPDGKPIAIHNCTLPTLLLKVSFVIYARIAHPARPCRTGSANTRFLPV